MPNRLKIINIIHILLVLGMNSTQFQLIFSGTNLKNLRKSMTIQWFFCWTMLNAKLRVRSEFVRGSSEIVDLHFFNEINVFKQSSRKFKVWQLPEKGGTKASLQTNVQAAFFLCVLCSACCIWELCTTEINFSLLAVYLSLLTCCLRILPWRVSLIASRKIRAPSSSAIPRVSSITVPHRWSQTLPEAKYRQASQNLSGVLAGHVRR